MNTAIPKLDTPNITAAEAIVQLQAQIDIDAPASLVFRSLRNTETWRDWNRFVPKVDITWQSPDTDHATAAEISELVRNTSLAGSFYSDLTDGGGNRPRSPDEQPPPRYRLNSISSTVSADSDAAKLDETRPSMSSDRQAGRRVSVASGTSSIDKALVTNTVNHRASLAVPLSPRGRRESRSGSASAAEKAANKAYQSLMAIYGEPSVRLQMGTKLTLFCRMKPASPSDYTQTRMVVIEVARPDDPAVDGNVTGLTRATTHSLERSGKYRVVLASDNEGASLFNVGDIMSGKKMPKYMLQAERVHEIVPTGDESCVYSTWELQKGHAAKSVKKKYGDFLQKQFQDQAYGLKEFCEGLHAPKIDRRDFSISLDDAPIVIQSF